MTNKKTTRRAFVSSIISLMLCIAMLVGTTFAWFTDTSATSVNTIQSGNLDMVLQYYDNSIDDWKEVESTTKLFKQGILWEPGHTEVAYLRINNAGTLNFKYELAIKASNEVSGTSVEDSKTFKLSEHLKYAVVSGATAGEYDVREDAIKAAQEAGATLLGNAYTSTSIDGEGNVVYATLEPNTSSDVLALIVYMPTEVGNEANYLTGTTPPSVDLGVWAMATQVPNDNETDSYGKDYDEKAGYPYEPLSSGINQIVAPDANGVVSVTSNDGNTKVTTKADEGSNVTITVEETAQPNLGNITIESDEDTVTLDISVEGESEDALMKVRPKKWCF